MNTRNKRFTVRLIGAAILAAALLFVGAGMSVYAAQASLPGDTLYPVKTTLEQTRISLAGDAARRANLQMVFAERRLEEIAGLVDDGRFLNLRTAAQKFEEHINQASAEVELVAQVDPARATVLISQISAAQSRFMSTLMEILASVPEPVRAEVLNAVDSTQVGSPVNGLAGNNSNQNDNSNGNENTNINETLNQNANESNTNSNLNLNGNANQNTNDNLNNSNLNTNDNLNNSNLNTNDDNSNFNTNDDNSNLNTNNNTNDDNSNLNSNSNINEDNSNVNSNSDLNTNNNQNTNDDNGGNDNSNNSGSSNDNGDDGGNSGKGGNDNEDDGY